VRNEEECVCCCNILISGKIIKEMPGSVASGTPDTFNYSRSQWPRGLRRWSAAARLLRLWGRITSGAWMSVVSVVWCQVEVSATS